jgi:hypothetical protein
MNWVLDRNIDDELTFNYLIGGNMWGKRLQVKVTNVLRR